ncbi:MAG: DUF1003 domain-containing protein [archaeon]
MQKKEEKGEVNKKTTGVLKEDIHPVFRARLTLGQKTADNLAKWAGSWAFIIMFAVVLVVWMLINGYYLVEFHSGDPFDPYPFILLNLVLSTLAAIQAPVILMSQNRAAQIDRIRAEYDYSVNRKTEREVRDIQKQLESIKRMLRGGKK